jgi:hypothetical protein
MCKTGNARAAAHAATGRAMVIAAAFLLGAVVALPAQQSGTAASPSTAKKEITIEELFLKSVEMQILREKAFAEDYEIKMSALDDLEKKVNDGSYSANDQQVQFVLEYLAMEGSARTTRQAGRLVNNYPEVRRRAASMLGRIGTEEAKNALVRVLLIDTEPVVRAEAAYGLGVIGRNQDNGVVQALAFAFNKEDPTKPDNNFGYALCLAIEKISKKNDGGIRDPSAYQMLVKIAGGNYLRTVKTKALQVLDELKSGR